MTSWTSDELTRLADADEMHIAGTRSDGSLRTPVIVWMVRLGDDLYTRSVNGPDASWFRGTRANHQGHISANGVERDVTFVDIDAGDPINADLDAAYRRAYNTRSLPSNRNRNRAYCEDLPQPRDLAWPAARALLLGQDLGPHVDGVAGKTGSRKCHSRTSGTPASASAARQAQAAADRPDQQAVRDRLAERRRLGELVVDVDRVEVAAEAGEVDDVRLRERCRRRPPLLADLHVVEEQVAIVKDAAWPIGTGPRLFPQRLGSSCAGICMWPARSSGRCRRRRLRPR